MEPEHARLAGEDYDRWWHETGEFELRQLLHWRWDPIGVAGAFPWAADEYDRYASWIAAALKEETVPEAVIDVLRSIEAERMGISDSVAAAEARRVAAAAIAEWHDNSQTRWSRFGARLR